MSDDPMAGSHDPLANLPAEPGMDLPAEPGTDLPAEPGTDLPAEPGTDLPAAPSPDLPAEPSYETSVGRVEEIIRCLDAGEASLGETLELVREGKQLIEGCARELQDVGNALEELRLEDLVARLESESAR